MLTSTPSAPAVSTSTAPKETGEKKALWDKRLSQIFWVNSVALSKDGQRVIAGTFIHDYEQRTGKFQPNVQGRFGTYVFDNPSAPPTADQPLLPRWKEDLDGWDGVYGVAISGNGKVAAACGWLEKNGNTPVGLLRAYDVEASKTDSVKQLLDYRGCNQRVSVVSLSGDGNVMAAVADDVYVFIKEDKAFNPIPLRLGVGGLANRYVTNVALHPDGTWLAACDSSGHVHVATIDNGAISSKATWSAGRDIPFLSVAIASDVKKFVAGGGNDVFLFDFAAIRRNPDRIEPVQYDTTAGDDSESIPKPPEGSNKIQENVRWVAISADGSLLTVVANRFAGEDKLAGKLIALTADLKYRWHVRIDNNPNSTSIDADGRYVTMADGWPPTKPAKFYLFNANGDKLWEFDTHSMNWPMVINTDGTAIVAGSDDGSVYYFKP